MLHKTLDLARKRMFSLHSYALIFMTNALVFAADTCVMDPHVYCKCTTSSGVVIDLSPLDTSTSDQPLFKDVPGKKPETFYSYRPCLLFTEKDPSVPVDPVPCDNVAACQKSSGSYFNIGDHKSVSFFGEPGTDSFGIKYVVDPRKLTVNLVCDKNAEKDFSVQGENPTNSYTFTLKTKYACLPATGLSIGSILLIVFFVLLLVYIVGGILFLRFVRGARGPEQIPNLAFWSDLPFLVKDGVLFIVRGCKAEGEQTYDRI